MRTLLMIMAMTAGLTNAAETVTVNVDTRDVPQHAAWAATAAELIRAYDAAITEKLHVDGITPPRVVDLVFDADMKGVAATSGTKIRIATKWIEVHPDDWGMVIHEYTHVVQSYPKYHPPWLVEGIADYIRFFMFEPEHNRPRPNPARSKFNDGYRTTAAFLDWIEHTHAPDVIERLNTALRRSQYTDALINEITGHTFPELWEKFATARAAAPNVNPDKEVQSMKDLNTVSYNIRHGVGMDGKLDLNRSAELMARLSPDLVALQEIDKQCTRSGGVDQALVLGKKLEMHHAFGKFMDFQGGEYGLAVLSRFPILKTVRHALPTGAEPRCALEIEVRPPRLHTRLSFVCVHMDWTDDTIRQSQVEALLKAVDDRPHPVILAGDFNARPDATSMQRLRDAGWTILPKLPPVNTFPADTPNVEIDYIVTRGLDPNTSCAVIEEAVISDHRPVQAQSR